MSAGPLENIRVLDVGHVVAGPFAGVLLADLGADVIKVEDPASGGDTLRKLSPKAANVPVWWKVAGRNKRSVAINLREQRGRDLLLDLVEHCDVMVENFRAGALERWNIGPDVLHARNSRLVLLRISGFGQGRLGAGRPGYGRIGEAMSGAAHLTGEPEGSPTHVGFSLGDATSGLLGAFGVLAALHARDQTGKGDVVDVALFESLFRMIEWQLPMADSLNVVARRRGNRFPIGSPVAGSFEARDGRWVTISAATESGIQRVLHAAGGSELASDPRFADPEARAEAGRLEEVEQAIAAWIRTEPSERVIETFEGTDVAAGFVYDAAMMIGDPIFEEREMVIRIDDDEAGSLVMPGVVPRLEHNPGRIRWAGPPLGQHTAEVLSELLGLTSEQLAELERAGIVTTADN